MEHNWAAFAVGLSCMFAGLSPAAETSTVIELKPYRELTVSQIVRNAFAEGGELREVHATPSTLWLLVQSKSAGAYSAVATDFNGNQLSAIPLGTDIRGATLTPTNRGIAAMCARKTGLVLSEYDGQGKLLSQERVACGAMMQMLSIRGNAATVCADGSIAEVAPSAATVNRSSWARQGALVELLATNDLAIVDQKTGQILLNNLDSGQLRPVTATVPEITDALQRNAKTRSDARETLPPGAPPPGNLLVAMGTAHDATGLYVLIWPYKATDGPAVVKFSNEGELAARYRCRFTSHKGVFRIVNVQNGFLILTSSSGQMFLYKL